MKLAVATDPRWLAIALGDFDATLLDHAHCEKKAASNALSLLQAYPEVPGLPAQMARLAREESAHLAKVLQVAEARGLTLGKDKGDPYARALQALFVRLAQQVATPEVVSARLATLLEAEGALVQRLPLRPAIH